MDPTELLILILTENTYISDYQPTGVRNAVGTLCLYGDVWTRTLAQDVRHLVNGGELMS